ncbi:MAG: CoA transferase [Pseudomonadales bacterium]|nr:CoA transferase [Pseudomonadales bacterium]
MQDSETDTSDESPSLGPLAGLRILDLCSVVSGPMAAVMLADQGADVIKIEPPGWGDGIRNLGASRNGQSAIFALINRNKRSIGINLKHPAGADIVRRLAESADVVMQNYRPGRMGRLDLGYEALRKLNPELIYTSISGVGEVGPYSEQRVFDYVIQGLSGVVDAQSTDGEPKMVRTILYDKLTALTAAQGITAALLARERGQGGTHVKLSMLDAGIYFNWPELMWNCSFEGEGVDYSGELADMYNVSKTNDGYIVSHHLGADTTGYSTDELVELLTANEVAVARVNSREDVLTDPQVEAMKLLHRFNHPRGGNMVLPRSPVRFGEDEWSQQRPSPEVGQHTVEVLSELGMTMPEMQALAREQAIG